MYFFIRTLGALMIRLPPRTVERLGAVLGWLWYYVLPVRRTVVQQNLERAFPDRSDRARARLARAAMQNLATHMLETTALLAATPADLEARIEWEGWEHIERALADGQGVLALGTHVDNPEWIVQGLGRSSIVVHAAVRWPRQRGVRRSLRELRGRAGFHGYEPRSSLRSLLEALPRNEVAAVFIDQAQSRRRGVFVPFLGYPACTTPGLAVLAQRSGRPVLPLIPQRVEAGRRRIQIGPPVPLDDLKEDPDFVIKATARFTAIVEAHIRRQPSRWLWAHRRFKIQPRPEDPIGPPQPVDLQPDGGVQLLDTVPSSDYRARA